MKTHFFSALYTAFFMFLFSVATYADETKTQASVWISAPAAIKIHKEIQKYVFVDVRDEASFDKIKIPGSINLGVHAIKVKSWLKSSKVILLNSGFERTSLENACKNLRASGYDVFVLSGGLVAWSDAGGRLEGKYSDLSELNSITPLNFSQEKHRSDQLVFYAGNKIGYEKMAKIFPQAINLGENEGLYNSEFENAIKDRKTGDHAYAIVTTMYGKNDERLMTFFKPRNGVSVFFLADGVSGYFAYVSGMERMAKPSSERSIKSERCISCEKNKKK